MPNAMNWFRRNQKIFLAVLGILCIVGFVLFDPLLKIFTGSNQGTNPIAVRTDFGDVREKELNYMVSSRATLNQFLELATRYAAQKATSGQPALAPQYQQIMLRQMQAQGMFAPSMASEEGVVRLMLLTHEAEKMGMSVSNESAYEWLRLSTFDQVTPDIIRAIITQLNTSQREIFNELRRALLATSMQESLTHINSRDGASPAQRWNYFQRLHREINAELIALPISEFVAEVPEPKDSALLELFEKHKHNYALPGQPTPGFRIPDRGKFEGFKAPFEQLASAVEVTDAEIEKYYNEHLDEFRYSGFATEPKPTEEATTEALKAEETPATEEKPGEATPESTNPPTKETKAEESASPEPAPATETPAESDEPANPGGGGDDAGPGEEANPASSESSPENTPSTESPTPSTTEPAAESPADQPAATGEPATPAAPSEPLVGPSPEYQLPEDIAGGENPEHDPLWKVTDTIRRSLVQGKVREKISAIFDELASAMDAYAQKVDLYELEVAEQAEKEGDKPKAPAPLDLKQLAQQHGLEVFSTDLLSRFDADSVEIGRATVNTKPFAEVAFANLPTFSPRRAEDLGGDQYLFWKTQASKGEVPTFEAAKPEVIAAWKTIEARKLAMKKAEEMATQANKANQSLKELFGGEGKRPIIDSGYFTWMTQRQFAPQFGPQLQLGVVPGAPNVGIDFMREAYTLDIGQSGAALNAPEDIAYVIRVTDQRPSTDELLARFMTTPYQQYASVSEIDSQEFALDWVRELEQEAGIEWERPPIQEVRSGR